MDLSDQSGAFDFFIKLKFVLCQPGEREGPEVCLGVERAGELEGGREGEVECQPVQAGEDHHGGEAPHGGQAEDLPSQ